MSDESQYPSIIANLAHRLEESVAHGQIDPKDLPKLCSEAAESLLSDVLTDPSHSLSERRRYTTAFEARLAERWGEAFDLFEIGLAIAQEAGESKNRRQRPQAAAANDIVFDAVIRLQARASLVASEVLALLKTGHASGAHARWRTLHELAVVTYFIDENGNGVAERYLLHNVIESYRAMLLYEKYCERLGLEPLDEGELDTLRKYRDQLVQRFGSGFAGDYGWAFDVFGRRPTLSDLEDRVNLGHMRPYYKMASHGVHANAKGALWNLGLSRTAETMLAGPSNAGLADPGHGAMITLHQVTSVALHRDPAVEDVIAMLVLDQLVNLAGNAFLEAHEQLERDTNA